MPNYNESKNQIALVNWFTLQYPDMHDLLMHIPNGVNTSAKVGARMKRSGLRAGYPDMALFVSTKMYHGLFIELKSQSGRLSKAQDKIQWQLENQGYKVCVCRSWTDALTEIQYYLDGYKGTDNGQVNKTID